MRTRLVFADPVTYVDEAETPELWIACDLCDVWYCGTCEHLTSVPEEEDTFALNVHNVV